VNVGFHWGKEVYVEGVGVVVSCVVQEGAECEGPVGGVVEVAWIDGDSGGVGGGAVEEVPGDPLLLACV
jgi:hypothetical protein